MSPCAATAWAERQAVRDGTLERPVSGTRVFAELAPRASHTTSGR